MSIILLPNVADSSADPYGSGYGKWRPILKEAVDTGYGWATSNALSNGAWWKGTWNQPVELTGVTLYSRTTGASDRSPTSTVELDDSSTFSVAEVASGSSVFVDFGEVKTVTWLKVTFTASAPGGGNPGWAYVAPQAPHSLVTAGTASSSGDPFGSSFASSKAIDGNASTSWATNAASCNGAWWKETWASPTYVSAVKLIPRVDSPSSSDRNPVATLTTSDSGSFSVAATPGNQYVFHVTFSRRQIDWIKVTFDAGAPGGGNPGWLEVEAYDYGVAGGGTGVRAYAVIVG